MQRTPSVRPEARLGVQYRWRAPKRRPAGVDRMQRLHATQRFFGSGASRLHFVAIAGTNVSPIPGGALRIGIGKQDAKPRPSVERGQVRCQGRFPGAALLVQYRNPAGHVLDMRTQKAHDEIQCIALELSVLLWP